MLTDRQIDRSTDKMTTANLWCMLLSVKKRELLIQYKIRDAAAMLCISGKKIDANVILPLK